MGPFMIISITWLTKISHDFFDADKNVFLTHNTYGISGKDQFYIAICMDQLAK